MTVVDGARVLLGVTVLLAAAAKVGTGLDQVAETLERYGVVPTGRERSIAAVLVVCEALAGLLLLSPWPRVGAALAMALAGVFAYAVSSSLARGDLFLCGCFGTSIPIRVSPGLLAADLVLFSLGLFVLAEPLASAWGVPWQRLALLTLTILVLGGSAQAARAAFFPGFPAGLAQGTPVPPVTVTDARGVPLRIDQLAAEGILLLFVAADCIRCRRLLGQLAGIGPLPVPTMIVGSSAPRTAHSLATRYGWTPAWTVGGEEGRLLRRRFRIPGSPAAVALANGRVMASAFPANLGAVQEATRRVLAATALDDPGGGAGG